MLDTTFFVVLAAIVLTALVIAGVIRRRPRSATIFCPLRGEVVEVKGGRCLAQDDGRLVGSIWDCQRECLAQPEVKAVRG